MYSVRWRYWSKTKIIVQACPGWGDGIDLEFFVSSFIYSVDASKYVVVHLVFFFSKSDHKSLSYGHFNITAQQCTRWGEGIDPKLKL